MDISIITASIGSFVLSERVIKAKAWILAVLGTVVAYDLTQTSEDPWSLRVYRGPALVAFTISCLAASLRIWRRSGVACDELLFLPGTPMAALHHPDVRCPEEAPVGGGESRIARYDGLSANDDDGDDADHGGIDGIPTAMSDLPPSPIFALEEGKSASSSAGEIELATLQHDESSRGGGSCGGGAAAVAAARRRSLSPANTTSGNANEADAAAGVMNVPQSPQVMRSRRNTGDDQLIRAANNVPSLVMASSRDEEDGHDGQDAFENDAAGSDGGADTGNACGNPSTPLPFRKRILQRAESVTKDESMIRYLLCSQAGESLRRRRGGNVESDATSTPAKSSSGDGTQPAPTGSSSKNARFKKFLRVARRLGLHHFIRSKPLENNEMTYAPSGPSVAGAAVDLCLPVLFNFHMFFLLSQQRAADIAAAMAEAAAEDSNDRDEDDDRVPKGNKAGNVAQPDGLNPRVLPLIFLSVLFIRAAFPPRARRRFWGTIKYTICAPFYAVYFRDAFIGDIFTSLVRPIQDLVYCLFYYSVSVWAMFSSTSSLDEAGDILKNSWVLHNFALPACAVLPLWWKFLQTLRQAKDSGQHWPHLGNAFKYLTAALVIFYAMAHPEGRRGKVWIASCIGTVVYQIWWDVWMDWELLEFVPWGSSSLQSMPSEGTRLCNCLTISSIPGSWCQNIVRPFISVLRRVSTFVASNKISLRSKRLYARDVFYWRVLAYNVCFRFIWMLSFIPAYHFSKSGTEVPTLSIDFRTYVGAFISVAELIRRCLWCVIKLELETIKVTDTEREYEPLMSGVDGMAKKHLNLNTMDEKFGDKQHPMHFMVSALQFESQALMLKGGIGPTSGMPPGGQGQTRSKQSRCTFSDNFLRRAFIVELIVWVAAFVGLSVLCVIR